MKKAVYIALTALLLSACANNAQTDKVDTSEISKADTVTTTTTVTSASAVITSAEKKEITTSGTTVTSHSETVAHKTESSSANTKRTTTADREKETADSQTGASVSDKTEPGITASVSVSESKPKVTTVSSAAHKPVSQSSTTARSRSETTKKSSTVTATAKPKPKKTTTTTTTTTTNTEEVEYVEIEDVTCLKTMVENLEETDTPPKYYEKIGKGLKHDGTDYGKAVAVYKWMRANGWGSCVYYSMETYFVCKGIGLECAYAFATKNDWYGHTYNVVKVNGTWFVLDTQGRSFLENSEYCTRMFDGNDNDLTPFKDDIWYDYDENGKYRNWTISD